MFIPYHSYKLGCTGLDKIREFFSFVLFLYLHSISIPNKKIEEDNRMEWIVSVIEIKAT